MPGDDGGPERCADQHDVVSAGALGDPGARDGNVRQHPAQREIPHVPVRLPMAAQIDRGERPSVVVEAAGEVLRLLSTAM